MSEVQYYGGSDFRGSGIMETSVGDISQDIYGDESGECEFKVRPGGWDHMPIKGSAHPQARHLLLERRRVRMTKGFWTIICSYKGFYSTNGSMPSVYELHLGSGTEPIQVHPDFVTKIAGLPSAPKNKALFVDGQGNPSTDDDLGLFEEFGVKSDLYGMDSYVDMNNITFTETWISRSMPNSGGKCEVQNPGGAPSFGDGRTWLYVGMSSSGERGGSCKNRKTWRLSGRGGWNSLVYKQD